ncbi:hypothetical protein BCR36DRAFT_133306 [Piromyces finnis]|uniref:Kinesin motor domain-containing protein n=1 Tax=Piromyces finnis TaxID=1754191 RepID=A0A1Y1VJ00_9FUNG|nr:hypothetical protein BCR36DRAFT_133306 [Piromyces finnis]|eukprot:ORX57692.1 hypothetical protein BCR36DRAFT_133306 [Piromyces finnis]
MSESSSQYSRKENFPLEENIKAILRLKPSMYDSDSYIESKSHYYDIVYSEVTSNRKIYDSSILSIVKSFMKGIDVNFMAFGPKDGGKTYTFIGENFNVNAFKKDSKGIALYAITSIFKALNFMKEKDIKYQIGYSLVEIPDENANYNFKSVSLHESFKGFNNLKDVKQAILKHYKDKKYENSHTIFNVSLSQYRMNKKTNKMMKLESKLNFIDFSHTITDKLLNQIELYPNVELKKIFHKIVIFCPCLDLVVSKALAGKDRTILFYCTPYLTDTFEEIEIIGKMESILQLFRQIKCNIDINCSESSNSTMVKENIAFLKKKLNKFKETIYIDEHGGKHYQGLLENGEEIDPVDLDMYDDSKENIEPDTDESSVIDSYIEENISENIMQDGIFNDEIIINNGDDLILGENIFKTDDDVTPKAAPAVTKFTVPYVSVSGDLKDSSDEEDESSSKEYIINEPKNEIMNYSNDIDYLETIFEEDSQEVIKAMEGINDESTSNILPITTEQTIIKSESSIENGEQIVTEKTYCEPVVTEEVVNEPTGGKKRIITINTETITVSKRKPIDTNKTICTSTTTIKSNGFINDSLIEDDEILEPTVETKVIQKPSIIKKTIITENTVINNDKPITKKITNEKPVRTASLKRINNITNDIKISNTRLPKLNSPESNSPESNSPKSNCSSPGTESINNLPKSSEVKSQTQTYLLPSLVPRRISSVRPSISPKMNSSESKERNSKSFVDNIINNKIIHNENKIEHNEEQTKKMPNITTNEKQKSKCSIRNESSVDKIEEELHEDSKIKTLTKAIEAKDAEIKDRMEIIKQYTDTLLSLEENQILGRKNSQKYKKFEKELKQRTEEGQQNIDELREKLEYLSALLNEKDKQINNTNDSIKNKERELESSKNKLSFLISVLDEKDAIIKKSNEKVKEIENKNQSLNDSVINYEEHINNLKDQLEEKEKINEALQAQMAELSDRINQAQERMEKLYQLQIKQKEKHKVQLEKQSLKYKKIIKKLIEKKRLSNSSIPYSEASRKDCDIVSNFSKDVPSDIYSFKSDLTDIFSDDDLANLASNQHDNKIYAEVLNHYNKIFKKLKEVLVENQSNDVQSLKTSSSLSNTEGTENVVRKAEEIVKTEHQHIKSEDNYQMDLVQAAETLNSQVNHWKQYSSDQQRHIENLQTEQVRLMEKIEALSKLQQPLKDGNDEENERLIKEANTTLENIKSDIMNSIIVDDDPVEDGKEFSLLDYKEELGLENKDENKTNKNNKTTETSSKPQNRKQEKIEKKNEQKIQQQNQKINDLRKCCDRQSEMIVNLEFSLMKAQAIIVSLTQNNENNLKFNDLTSNISSNDINTPNNKSTTYKRNKERINPLIYNTNHNIEDSMEIDESISQIQPDLYDVCNLNEYPVFSNPDISTLLNSREFKNYNNSNNIISNSQDQSSSFILDSSIIKADINDNPNQISHDSIVGEKESTTTTSKVFTQPVNNINSTGKNHRDSQVTLINDINAINNIGQTYSPSKNNIYRQSMLSQNSKYSTNDETNIEAPSMIPSSQINSTSIPPQSDKLLGRNQKSKKSENKDGKRRNPLKNIFSKSSTESIKSDSDKASLKKKESKRSSFTKFFSRKNKSNNNSSNSNTINDSNSIQSTNNNKLLEEKILISPIQIDMQKENKEFDNDSDDDMPILQLQQKRINQDLLNSNTSSPNAFSAQNPPTQIKINSGTYSKDSSPYITPHQSYSSSHHISPSTETTEYYDTTTEVPKGNTLKNLHLHNISDNEPEVIQPLNPTIKSENELTQTQSELKKESGLLKQHPKIHKYIDDKILDEKKQEFDNIPKGHAIDKKDPLLLSNFSSTKIESDPENLNKNMNSNIFSTINTQNSNTSVSCQPNEANNAQTINNEINETLWSPYVPNNLTTTNEMPIVKETINTTDSNIFFDDNLKSNFKPKIIESHNNYITMNKTLLNDEVTVYPITETLTNVDTTTEIYKPNSSENIKIITTNYQNELLNSNLVDNKTTSTNNPFFDNNNEVATVTLPNVKRESTSASPKSTQTTIKKTITTKTTTTTNKNSSSPKSTSVKKVITKTSPKMKNSTSSSSGPVVKKIIKTITTTTTTNNNNESKISETKSKVNETITLSPKNTSYQPSFKNNETTYTTTTLPKTISETKITYQPTFKTNYSPKISEINTDNTKYSPKITETITETITTTTTTSTNPTNKNNNITTMYKSTVDKKVPMDQTITINESSVPMTTYITETNYQSNNDQSIMPKISHENIKNMDDITKQNNNLDDIDYYTTKIEQDLFIDGQDEIDDDLEDVANTTMKSIEKYEFLKRSSIKRNAKLFHNNGNSEEAQKEMDKLNEISQSIQDLKEKNRVEMLEINKKLGTDEYENKNNNNINTNEYNVNKPIIDKYENVTTTNTTNTSKKPNSDECKYITTTTTTTTTFSNGEKSNIKQKKNRKFRLFSKCTGNKDDDVYIKKNKSKAKNKKNNLKTSINDIVVDNNEVVKVNSVNSKNKGKSTVNNDYFTSKATNQYTENSEDYLTAVSSSEYVKKDKKYGDDDSEYYYIYDTTEKNTVTNTLNEKNKKKQKGVLHFNYFD